MQIALAEDNGARGQQRFNDRGVALGPMAFEAGRAARRRQVGGVEVVLQRKRHTMQRAKRRAGRAPPIGLPRGLADRIRIKCYEGREACVSRGPRKQGIRQVFSGDIAGADGGGGPGYSKFIERGQGAFPSEFRLYTASLVGTTGRRASA